MEKLAAMTVVAAFVVFAGTYCINGLENAKSEETPDTPDNPD